MGASEFINIYEKYLDKCWIVIKSDLYLVLDEVFKYAPCELALPE